MQVTADGTPKRVATRPGRLVTLVIIGVLAAIGLGGVFWYSSADRVGPGVLISLELAGTVDEAKQIVCQWPAADTRSGCTPAQFAAFRHDQNRAWPLLISSTISLLGLCAIGALLFSSGRARRIARVGVVLAMVFALLSALSVALVGVGLTALQEGRSAEALWVVLGAAATVGYVVLIFVTGVAAVSTLILVFRALMPAADFSALTGGASTDGGLTDGGLTGGGLTGGGLKAGGRSVEPPPTIIEEDGGSFPDPWAPVVTMSQLEREGGGIGICVSGGGIRAATVTLGALQSLRQHGILTRARYLVSVSGGGYMTGAFQMAMQPAPDSPTAAVPTARDVFAPGSSEEGHIRRHGMYIADSRREWIFALATVLRGALASLLVLAGLVTAVGIIVGFLYRLVPLASFDYDFPFSAPAGSQAPSLPPIRDAVRWGIGLSAALGIGCWMVLVVVVARKRLRSGLKVLSDALLIVAAATALLGVVVPVVVWAGARVLWWLEGTAGLSAAGVASSGAAGTVTIAYLGSLVSILWRSRKRVGEVRKMFGAKSQLQQRVPTAWSQRMIVWLVLLTLIAAYATLFGVVVRTAWAPDFRVLAPMDWTEGQWMLALTCVGFVIVAFFVDQTWMSLQPFYRRRLASAFAVRRMQRSDVAAARPYDWSGETTTLSTYGRPPEGFPQVIFAAAANLSGSNRTPPGRRAVSFSLSHDWIGGPQVGYVRTEALERQLGGKWRNLGLDLTVQNAVAVSGAAFASAMGGKSTAFQTLFALSNARLGTWLPNPAWLYARCTQQTDGDWLGPRLPRIRRLTYFLREVGGLYDDRDRFLLVTDGGHYDNLGLVELLRHRCETVFCIDSSGDAPPLAGALSEAITLAREELDVVISLHRPRDLVPGSGAPLDPADPLATLNARLSHDCVVTGTVTYPEQRLPDGTVEAGFVGRIVVAKTTLTGQLPYELLTYAVSNPVFPHDSTGDQWFDHGQFNAYHALGRQLGNRAALAHPQQPIG